MAILAGKFRALLIVTLAAALLGSVTIEKTWAREKKWKPTIKMTKLPVFPTSLINSDVTKGRVRVAIALSEDGSLIDWLAIKATHAEMAKAVGHVIEGWDFEGLRSLNEPRGEAYLLDVDFESGGGAFATSSTLELSDHIFGSEEIPGFEGIKLATLSELDALPLPIHTEHPPVPPELKGYDRQEVVFEFYIDTDGMVHIPLLKSTETKLDERILLASQNALWKWRFFPPTSNGRPVVVKVSQPLVFLLAGIDP